MKQNDKEGASPQKFRSLENLFGCTVDITIVSGAVNSVQCIWQCLCFRQLQYLVLAYCGLAVFGGLLTCCIWHLHLVDHLSRFRRLMRCWGSVREPFRGEAWDGEGRYQLEKGSHTSCHQLAMIAFTCFDSSDLQAVPPSTRRGAEASRPVINLQEFADTWLAMWKRALTARHYTVVIGRGPVLLS